MTVLEPIPCGYQGMAVALSVPRTEPKVSRTSSTGFPLSRGRSDREMVCLTQVDLSPSLVSATKGSVDKACRILEPQLFPLYSRGKHQCGPHWVILRLK